MFAEGELCPTAGGDGTKTETKSLLCFTVDYYSYYLV